MANCPNGLTFARNETADCAHVQELCGYTSCSDGNGTYCYGIDGVEGYRAGFQNVTLNTACDTNCPMAWEAGYPIDWVGDPVGSPMCCDNPGKVVACRPLCECYDVSQLAATLTPLSIPTSVASTAVSTLTSRSTSPLGTSMTTTSQTQLPTQGTIVTPSPSNGLSTDAKAGIGVGAVVGGAAVFGLIFWLALVLRKRRKETANLSPGVDTGEPEWKDRTHEMRNSNPGVVTGMG